jgi:hypothetical protein
MRGCKDLDVRNASESILVDRPDIPALRAEKLDDFGVDVLIREDRIVTSPHAEILSSQTISFFNTRAAYSNAA